MVPPFDRGDEAGTVENRESGCGCRASTCEVEMKWGALHPAPTIHIIAQSRLPVNIRANHAAAHSTCAEHWAARANVENRPLAGFSPRSVTLQSGAPGLPLARNASSHSTLPSLDGRPVLSPPKEAWGRVTFSPPPQSSPIQGEEVSWSDTKRYREDGVQANHTRTSSPPLMGGLSSVHRRSWGEGDIHKTSEVCNATLPTR